MRNSFIAAVVAAGVLITGCTVHPIGEREERADATAGGKPFIVPVAQRTRPTLPDKPTADDLVNYALLTSPELEMHYWQWRAAIEQIPQDGTQATNFAITGGTAVSRGNFSLDRTSLTLGNDPMADIVLPSKLSAAARRALQNARAAGERFREAKLDLRRKVLDACYDYALTCESIRLQSADRDLLTAMRDAVEARGPSGAATQQEVLKTRNELDLSLNDLANLESQRSGQRSAILSVLSLPPTSEMVLPQQLPAPRPLDRSDPQMLKLAATRNRELRALAAEMRGQGQAVTLAKLQRLPDFSVAASTDLAGITQSLSGMITAPILRHEAITASIAQAKARLGVIDAMARQAQNDVAARLLLDITVVRDADRQLNVFDKSILPRVNQIVSLGRTGYETGQSSLTDWLEARRSLITVSRLRASLAAEREKRRVDIDVTCGIDAPMPR